jgi:hypothetical protein
MRNVIARAPYHLHQIKSYESDIYFKGTFILEKMPALLTAQIDDMDIKGLIGKLMVYESHNEVKYRAPNHYEQRVVALSSTIPEMLDITDRIPVNVVTMNIYNPQSYGGLLGPGSFALYKFQMEDVFNEDEHTIYKIRVIPRKNNAQLVSGWLHIVDNTWTVSQASLEMSDFGSSIQYNLNYHEIKPGAFLPTSSDINVEMSVLGIKAGGRFYASVKYGNLETNDSHTVADVAIIDGSQALLERPPLSVQQQKNLQKLEELAAKEKLTNRDAAKMAQLAQKTLETDEMKTAKRQLERRPVDSMIVVTRDSLALLRDSSFWNNIRTQPLRDEEQLSYLQHDSLKINADSLKNRTAGKWISNLLMGEKLNLSKKYYIKYDGLIKVLAGYNFVNGYRIGQTIETGINFDHNRSLSITPAVYYTTARKQMDFTLSSSLVYAPLYLGKLSVSTGNTIADFAGKIESECFLNEFSSFLIARNITKFYQKRFVTFTNEIDIANGLRLTTGINHEKRNDLENVASWNLSKKEPASNRPHGQVEKMPDNEANIINIGLSYTPRHYYMIRSGQKRYLNSDFPTVSLRYSKGFSKGNDINPSFDKIETSIVQTIQLGLFDQFLYAVNAGAFLSAKQTYLPDYKHFPANEIMVTDNPLYTSFMLDNYRYATNDKWLQAHVSFTSQYLLLKNIPFLQSSFLDEAIHLKTLWTPDINHNEAGYSIGLGDVGRIGIIVGFRKMKYENVGFVISLPLLNMLSQLFFLSKKVYLCIRIIK